ncbi:MAG: deoxyhypusine synthase [Conexivisphaerales archaeon]
MKHPFSSVEDYEAQPGLTRDLLKKMKLAGGFQASHLGRAADILRTMWYDKKCTRMLSFTADIVSTGLRGVLRQLVREGTADMIITTCGTLDHDIARSVGEYLEGDFSFDDRELLKRGYHRLGNVLIPRQAYGPAIERFMQKMLEEKFSSSTSPIPPHQIIWEAGKRLDEKSILYWAYKKSIPVIVPGIFDGAFGSQLWLFYQSHRRFQVDMMADQQLIADTVFSSQKLGALILGGGISKHHTIWWAQFKSGLDFAVYVTTATEYDGSLSGAQLREAISWSKVKPKAKQVTVIGDATVILPLLVSASLKKTGNV